jgi:formylglycine-generating enzyme required for sulfatase activity
MDWLNKKSSRKGYRLPSESEWEYAARAGSTGPRYSPPDEETCHYAVTAVVSPECQPFKHTMPVGDRTENAFHLFDMLGNASVWTEDCWNNSYSGAPTKGEVWKNGNCNLRAVRGGSSMHGLAEVRSAFRTGFAPNFEAIRSAFAWREHCPSV